MEKPHVIAPLSIIDHKLRLVNFFSQSLGHFTLQVDMKLHLHGLAL